MNDRRRTRGSEYGPKRGYWNYQGRRKRRTSIPSYLRSFFSWISNLRGGQQTSTPAGVQGEDTAGTDDSQLSHNDASLWAYDLRSEDY